MANTAIYVVVGILVVCGVCFQVVRVRSRHRRDFREHLEPILAEYGLLFLSSTYPGMFKVGPFPKFEIQYGRPQSGIGGVRGEYNEYRVVEVQDDKGESFKLWALLEFELFHLRRVRWRAEKGASLPEAARQLIEH
jgi:hypothetical protein